MAKTSDTIATERELDERLLELQLRKRANDERVRRRQIHFDIGLLVFVGMLVLTYASLPILPDQVSERLSRYVDNSWEFLPIVFIGLAVSRVITYMLTRSYPGA